MIGKVVWKVSKERAHSAIRYWPRKREEPRVKRFPTINNRKNMEKIDFLPLATLHDLCSGCLSGVWRRNVVRTGIHFTDKFKWIQSRRSLKTFRWNCFGFRGEVSLSRCCIIFESERNFRSPAKFSAPNKRAKFIRRPNCYFGKEVF